MRIAGGVVLLIAAVWSLIDGGCNIASGRLANESASAINSLSKMIGNLADANPTFDDEDPLAEPTKPAKKKPAPRKIDGNDYIKAGAVFLASAVICIISGILFFTNRGKILGFVAVAAGIASEIAFYLLVKELLWWKLFKIALFGFSGFVATQIGKPDK